MTPFFLATNLKRAVLPDTIGSIHEDSFYGSGLTSVVIPKSVGYLGHAAFADCRFLESVTFEEGNERELKIYS